MYITVQKKPLQYRGWGIFKIELYSVQIRAYVCVCVPETTVSIINMNTCYENAPGRPSV